MKDHLKTFLKGTAVGVANIIPGVSGGTMALILGIYERCLGAISALKIETIKKFFWLFSKDEEKRQQAKAEMQRIDLLFLVLLAAGALLAIVALAKVMTLLLNNFHDPTYGFFFGLVIASALVPWKLVKKRTVWVVLLALVGVGCGVGCDFLMSNERKIANAEEKIVMTQLKERKKELLMADKPLEVMEIDQQLQAMSSGRSTVLYYVELVVAGALAISAMILPGISGSFLLLAMGFYFDILAAISGLKIGIIFLFGLGCLIGLLGFSHFLTWLLKRAADPTMGFLTGLMVGSLWTIWPFRVTYLAGQGGPLSQTVYLGNRWPAALGTNEVLTIVTMLLGIAVVLAFMYYEKKHQVTGETNVQ